MNNQAETSPSKLIFIASICAIYVDFYLKGKARFCERKSLTKLIDQLLPEVRKSFKDDGVRRIDPNENFTKAADTLKKVYEKNEGIPSSIFLDLLREESKNLSQDELTTIFNATVRVCRLDGVLQEEEQEILENLNEVFKLDGNIDGLAHETDKKRKWHQLSRALIVLSVIMLFAASWLIGMQIYHFMYPKLQKVMDAPQYKFGSVMFSRYIVVGNAIQEKHLNKSEVFYAHGEARLLVDFKPLQLQCHDRTLSDLWNLISLSGLKIVPQPIECDAIYYLPSNASIATDGATVSDIPMLIDVQFDQEGGWQKIAEITPEPVSTKNLDKIPKMIGIASAVGGAAFAYKYSQPTSSGGGISSLISSLPFIPGGSGGFNMLMRAGATLGGGAIAGGAAYMLTRDTLSMVDGLELQDKITAKQEERIKEQSKLIVAAEMAADDELNRWYSKAFNESVKRLYAKIGVKINTITVE